MECENLHHQEVRSRENLGFCWRCWKFHSGRSISNSQGTGSGHFTLVLVYTNRVGPLLCVHKNCITYFLAFSFPKSTLISWNQKQSENKCPTKPNSIAFRKYFDYCEIYRVKRGFLWDFNIDQKRSVKTHREAALRENKQLTCHRRSTTQPELFISSVEFCQWAISWAFPRCATHPLRKYLAPLFSHYKIPFDLQFLAFTDSRVQLSTI